MVQRIDFASEAFFRDPAATVARLRGIGAAVETRFPIVGKVWVTTTYEATARVLKESTTFSLRQEGGEVAGLRWWSAWEALWANVTIFNRAARSLTLGAVRELTLGDPIVAEAAETFGMRSAAFSE